MCLNGLRRVKHAPRKEDVVPLRGHYMYLTPARFVVLGPLNCSPLALPLDSRTNQLGKILGVWVGQCLLEYCRFYLSISIADSQIPSTYFSIGNSTFVLPRLTLRFPVLTLLLLNLL